MFFSTRTMKSSKQWKCKARLNAKPRRPQRVKRCANLCVPCVKTSLTLLLAQSPQRWYLTNSRRSSRDRKDYVKSQCIIWGDYRFIGFSSFALANLRVLETSACQNFLGELCDQKKTSALFGFTERTERLTCKPLYTVLSPQRIAVVIEENLFKSILPVRWLSVS